MYLHLSLIFVSRTGIGGAAPYPLESLTGPVCVYGSEVRLLPPIEFLSRPVNYTSYHHIHVLFSILAISSFEYVKSAALAPQLLARTCSLLSPRLLARMCSLLSPWLCAEDDLALTFRRYTAVQARASAWGWAEGYIGTSLPIPFLISPPSRHCIYLFFRTAWREACGREIGRNFIDRDCWGVLRGTGNCLPQLSTNKDSSNSESVGIEGRRNSFLKLLKKEWE